MTYEFALKKISEYKKELGSLDYVAAGGIGGVCCWSSSYAIDVIKTKIQAEILKEKISVLPTGKFVSYFFQIY